MSDNEVANHVSAQMGKISEKLDDMIVDAAGQRVPFTLFVWTPGSVQFTTSGDLADVIPVMKRIIARWERVGLDPTEIDKIDPPLHRRN